MSDKVEIPDEAVSKAAWVFSEQKSRAWLTFSDETRAAIARSWEPTARAALEAALPLLLPTREEIAAVSDLRAALKDLLSYCAKYVDDPDASEDEQIAYDDVHIRLAQLLGQHPASGGPAWPTREQADHA